MDDDELLLDEKFKDEQSRIRFIKKKAQQLAKDTKQKIPPIALSHIVSLVQDQEKIKVHFKFLDMSLKFSGQYVKVNDTVGIICNKKHSRNRQRFTVAHEIGHLVLDHQFSIRDHKEIINFKTKSPIEKEANIFAAELLMPRKVLLDYLKTNVVPNVKAVAKVFQVSEEALWYKITSDKLDKYL